MAASFSGYGLLTGAQRRTCTFAGTKDQVAAVRRFVRAQLGEHPASPDAVLVASELAANAIAHTSSGQPGGTFTVQVSVLSTAQAAVLVADQGGATEPQAQNAGIDSESGRGLDVVTALATVRTIRGERGDRRILAVIPPHPWVELQEG